MQISRSYKIVIALLSCLFVIQTKTDAHWIHLTNAPSYVDVEYQHYQIYDKELTYWLRYKIGDDAYLKLITNKKNKFYTSARAYSMKSFETEGFKYDMPSVEMSKNDRLYSTVKYIKKNKSKIFEKRSLGLTPEPKVPNYSAEIPKITPPKIPTPLALPILKPPSASGITPKELSPAPVRNTPSIERIGLNVSSDNKYDLKKQPKWIDSANTKGNAIYIDKESIYKKDDGYVYAVKYISKNNEQVVSWIYTKLNNNEAGIITTVPTSSYVIKYDFDKLDAVNMKKLTKDSPLYNSYDIVSKIVQNKNNKIEDYTVDFGPYMKELQRKIKDNWNPPKGNTSKRVVVLFEIEKNGRLSSVKIHQSSGITAVDQSAITAVKNSVPFMPLPEKYKGESIDIQFTFDYNIRK